MTQIPSENLSKTHARCFQVLDAIDTPIVLQRDETLLFVNTAFEVLSGCPRERWIGVPYQQMVVIKQAAVLEALNAQCLRGEATDACCEFVMDVAGLNECWVSVTVRCVDLLDDGLPTVMYLLHDLTERRAATQRERQLNRLLNQIIDGDPVATFVLDRNHRITHWNAACAQITGMSAQAMLGSNRQWAAFYPEPRAVMADLILDESEYGGFKTLYARRCVRSALIEGAFEAEDFFPQFGESGRWLYFVAAPLRDEQGQIVGAIETLQDVTARHVAEDELRAHHARLEELVQQRTSQLNQANEQLLHSEKLASIGQLAAGVAHEINNPIGYVHSNIGALEDYINDLFGILGNYQAALESMSSAEQLTALQATIQAQHGTVDLAFLKEDIPLLMRESREGITRVKKIVQDLKDFSHVDSTQDWQWADLHKGIDSTLNIVSNEIKYKADVVREYGELPAIECLPSQLNQVFMNLLVNAAHAMGEARGRIVIRSGVTGDHVWLEFEDNGSGIPAAALAKVFDPFFTTKPVGKGTGLGLSMAYGIIQKHGGSIVVKSTSADGTIFRIELPISRAENPNEVTQ